MASTRAVPPICILLVDDEPAVRRITSRVLSAEGFRVYEASDGGEALAVLEMIGEVDLVITDVRMPAMDGPTLVGAILERYPQQRFVYISAFPAENVVKLGGEAPVHTFLAKPFTLDDLLAKVKAALARPGGESGRRVPPHQGLFQP